MLHEVLLALSGHPSPLFNSREALNTTPSPPSHFPYLSPSERALLQSIGQLSELHRKLRRHVELIASTHDAMICRATASSIRQTHLARFQNRILDVEKKILKKDAAIVGAYNIVSLASVVSEFDDWHRLMDWYWKIACFLRSPNVEQASNGSCSGAALIDHLRAEANTGYPEIADAAKELSTVAEMVWLKQLASWVLYGKTPSHGSSDFFIQANVSSEDGTQTLRKEKILMPTFVSPESATSVLFIGRSLRQIRQHKNQLLGSSIEWSGNDDKQLASSHMQHLSALSLPVQPSQLSRAILAIRMSLSQNALQHLLPIELTLQVLECLRQYFLLVKGEFALALIDQADSRLLGRQQSMARLLQQDPLKALQGLSIKDAELQQTLAQTWKALSREDSGDEDNTFEFARERITLGPPRVTTSRPSTSDSIHDSVPELSIVNFNDLLFPTPTSLDISLGSPIELFISHREVETYSVINTYLLSIRRAEVHLSELWRRTSARRDQHPPSSRISGRLEVSLEGKALSTKRRREARKVWATCSAALFLISETAAYFEGEIIQSSCDHFEHWIKNPMPADTRQDANDVPADSPHRDPETLSSAHRSFLASIAYALLLTDLPYTRELRSLLGNIDNLIAYFTRLLDIQTKLDLERDAGTTSNLTAEDERRVSLELDRARKKVDSDLRSVVHRLRLLDRERIGSARYLNVGSSRTGNEGFEPWKGGGVDRLLMKLEFSRVREDGRYEVV